MQASSSLLALVLLATGAVLTAGARLRNTKQVSSPTVPARAANLSGHLVGSERSDCTGGHCGPAAAGSNRALPLPAKTANLSVHVAGKEKVLKSKTPSPTNASNVSAHVASKRGPRGRPVTNEQVELFRKRLDTMAARLQGMLDRKKGPLGNTTLAPSLKVFARELKQVLANTTTIKDPANAMQQLQAVARSVGALTKDLTSRQEQLMREDESQRESLLLGVLMAKQKAPVAEQMAVLQDADFRNLAISKALLAKHNASRPLYMQAAEFLDKHHDQMHPVAETSESRAASKAYALALSFQKRVDSMETELKAKQRAHEKRARLLEERVKKAKTDHDRRMALYLKKQEARDFRKFHAMRLRDMASMKAAVEAVKTGDVKALARARAALVASLKALKRKNSGFLVLLSMGHKLMGKDCPYCAAQCVEHCHQSGKPYVACLGDCADVGKGQ